MSKHGSIRDNQTWGAVQELLVHLEILVACHVDWKPFGCVAEGECDTVIVGFHLAFLIESVAEDGLAYVIVARDKSLDLWKSTRVCHVGQQRVVEGCGEVRPSLR